MSEIMFNSGFFMFKGIDKKLIIYNGSVAERSGTFTFEINKRTKIQREFFKRILEKKVYGFIYMSHGENSYIKFQIIITGITISKLINECHVSFYQNKMV